MDIVSYVLSKSYTDEVLAGLGGVGKDGTTFTPSVSEDGIISWTNNGGLENPPPVKIMGKDGEAATIKIGTVETIENTEQASVENVGTETNAVFNFKIPKGANGENFNYNIGNGLLVNEETNTLYVNTSNSVEEDNTLPITSAAVYTEVGNINVLLSTI